VRVYVESFGCAQNQGEGHAIERQLHDRGHAIVGDPAEADVGVLVTCAVVGTTEARMVRRWSALVDRVPHLVVTGCMVPLRASQFTGPGRELTSFLPIREQPKLPELVEQWGSSAVDPGEQAPPAPSATEEVVVAQGCTSHCTYCFSRLARGRLTSVPLTDLLDRVRAAADRGAAEIRLSSLDTSCWGEDLPGHPRLPELVRAASSISGGFRLRVGMMSPQSLAPIGDEYFEAVRDAKAFRFLHLPVQSGSDAVLDGMRRGYHVADFLRLVAAARRAMPDAMVATDVIVGFPTESEDDFRATAALVEEVGPEMLNVTRFSPRPGTPAANLEELPARVVKRRSRELTELRMRVARTRMEGWIGWEGPAQIVEHGADGSSMGRLPNYLPVVLDERISLGAVAPVRVEGARSTYLLARRIGPSERFAPVGVA
jgi:threonylcarbamoyladenosine tRNA methylthiotransferase CDKAL1